jgi:Domain of unknown function (DUF4145)
MSEIENETKRILCNHCRGITHHHLRVRYSRVCQVVVDGDGQPWTFGFGPRPDNMAEFRGSRYEEATNSPCQVRTSVWSCAGCDEETFERQHLFEVSNAEWEEHERFYYPERWIESIQPKHFRKLDSKLSQVYSEIIGCFNRGSLLLCTIGLRALLEGICRDKGLNDGNLERKIEGLIKFLPSVNVIEALHNFRFAGNNAAHDLDALSHDDAAMAIGIIEDLLNFLYDLDYKASQMRVASNRGAPKSGVVH